MFSETRGRLPLQTGHVTRAHFALVSSFVDNEPGYLRFVSEESEQTSKAILLWRHCGFGVPCPPICGVLIRNTNGRVFPAEVLD